MDDFVPVVDSRLHALHRCSGYTQLLCGLGDAQAALSELENLCGINRRTTPEWQALHTRPLPARIGTLHQLAFFKLSKPLQARVDRFNADAAKDPAGTFNHVGKAFLGSVPTAILALLPFFAGILALVYWPRRTAYGTHFVFTLHLHAFWYLCLWLLVLAPCGRRWASRSGCG
jgi:hypothetical protein